MTRALDLVSLGYVMDRLGLSKWYVLQLVKAGKIPATRRRFKRWGTAGRGRVMWVFEAREIDRVRQQRFSEGRMKVRTGEPSVEAELDADTLVARSGCPSHARCRGERPRPRGITLAPPQRAPQPRNAKGSWWLEAKRDGFTATALDHLPKETLSAGASMALQPWPGQNGQDD